MKHNNSKKVIAFILVILLCVPLTGMILHNQSTEITELNVALYTYVPDLERFEEAILEGWAKIQPNVTLNLVEWDSYDEDPGEDLDVFVFDALFLTHFIESGYLLPIEDGQIDNQEDILSFVMDGCIVDGVTYGIPQIICSNLLYTRVTDEELNSANTGTIYSLYDVIGDRVSTGVLPELNEGLLVDMHSNTVKACFFLDAFIDQTQVYTEFYELPDLNNINEQVVENLQLMVTMGGAEQVTYWPEDDDAYIRATWFGDGYGRALIAYTEAMSGMSEDEIESIRFCTVSLSSEQNIPLMFGDIVGINANVTDSKKQEICLQLANYLASCEMMVDAIEPGGKYETAQYLLPARISVYQELQDDFPLYGKLLDIADNSGNKLFKTGPDIREWMDLAHEILPDLILPEHAVTE